MNNKPDGELKWTGEQGKAIFLRGKDILVTAGAGSGKTRVLVERIIRKITDGESPIDIDRLLVVTFTKAAASEMKQRIGIALKNALQKNPRSQHLHRQLLLLNQATIATVHSFCLDVIRQYYYLQELDPSFRVLDETAAELLRQEILEEILDEYYDSKEPESPFYRLVEAYSSDRGDQGLQSLVLRLYSFARSHPFPSLWLQAGREAFFSGLGEGGAENPWIALLLEECRGKLAMAADLMEEMIRIASVPGGPAPYLVTLQEELIMLRKIEEASRCGWDELFSCMQQNPFGKLKPCRGDAYDTAMKERVQGIRDKVKKELNKLREDYFKNTLHEQLALLERYAPLISSLIELVEVFASRYQQAKKEKGAADFSDLEHYALQILNGAENRPGELAPSKAALEYRNFFREILIDEYQDINQVQEAILTLISSTEEQGNRFMVGDVKQSIYRFRLAEPGLFLQKQHLYGQYPSQGCCIHLNKNFRSRREILGGINYLFSRIMDEAVGEIDYDQAAWLHYGGLYPPADPEGSPEGRPGGGIDFLLIDRQAAGAKATEDETREENEEEQETEWETAALEGRLIAGQIKRLLGEGGSPPLQLYDTKRKSRRRAAYRDMAVLLRSAKNYAPAILEELQHAGIPAYAELAGGFFDAVEIKVMLSLLRIIDNPFQDLPLAGVLRSPILGLKAEELALIRTAAPSAGFFDALLAACGKEELLPRLRRQELQDFLKNLEHWQELAARHTIVDLIRHIYRETGYYDLVGAMPAGKQRQANLQALYDRARLYESSSPKGLFRFLNFMEKLRDRGEDLEAARALGEQEDVVRILTVHKSKGLEFPVVFLAGANKAFNRGDLRQHFLLHRELGFGPKYIDAEHRLIYPTLPWYAIRERLHAELLAEEMRILYVAMTRAEEKLILVATVNNLAKKLSDWQIASRSGLGPLPKYFRAGANCYLDWIGPALLQHPFLSGRLVGEEPMGEAHHAAGSGILSWNISFFTPAEIAAFPGEEATKEPQGKEGKLRECLKKIARMEPLPLTTVHEELAKGIDEQLSWQYPWQWAAKSYAKVSVSELPRLRAAGLTESDEESVSQERWRQGFPSYFPKRPRFLEDKGLTGAERGTAYHTVMQRLELIPPLNIQTIQQQLQKMLDEGYLDPREHGAIDPKPLARFFATPLGERIIRAYPANLWRELPFTLTFPADAIYNTGEAGRKDPVLIQGVIDCLFRENAGYVLVDYKTGDPAKLQGSELEQRYLRQLDYYTLAIEKIWDGKVYEKYLYFLDKEQLLEIGSA